LCLYESTPPHWVYIAFTPPQVLKRKSAPVLKVWGSTIAPKHKQQRNYNGKMATLHEALKTLSPVDFSAVPANDAGLKSSLTESFRSAQLLVDSVPIPPPAENQISPTGRSRSNTASSSASEVSLSSTPSPPPPSDVGALQKEWGRPLKLNPRENPLGMSVYKLAGKDGKGAWFARRSVHEGLGFEKWKRGLEREFPKAMKVQGGPGEGNIRGIGAERRVEYKAVSGVGKMEG
jgi:hypothetical protein